ncbi:uncharacterized protein LOC114357894 [Ostrinia furnacalis]|uniref:uncharacterized protein LOC114357894 n=1 Tax=Ostrinia furnacalis TaxID=93504 RepID=UPI00103FD584|nr:uncharacterized protein LOC114357894 [Ostrinia furnacalis]
MSKRSTNTPIGHDAKKPKLHITRSDHPIPSSQQNSSFSIIQENECDVWGDDADDEILLQASQACDEESNDISILPDYSNWKQPASTSTQYQPSPSTSKASFEFKKPSSKLPASVHLKYKCNTISSPLPGISTMSHNRPPSITDDLAISDKIVSGDDSDVWRRLLLLEEENNKLKSEYGKLSDKVVTKEGEASILRSQLKASQLANDNARMDKIRAQERVQMECDEKMAAMTRELQSLKSQLEFKDLEILNVKDKFKKLEANKLRQNEILSHRNNNTVAGLNDGMTQQKKVQTTSSSIQTEDKAPFIKLNKYRRRGDFHTPTKKDGNSQLSEVLGSLRELKWELEAGAPADVDEPQPDTLGPDVSLDRLRDVFPLYRGERGVAARLVLAALASEPHPPLARDQWDHILTWATEICILIEKQVSSGLFPPLVPTAATAGNFYSDKRYFFFSCRQQTYTVSAEDSQT